MAVLSVVLPDEVVATYAKYDKNPANAVAAQVVKYQYHDPKDRVVVLPTVIRKELEGLMGRPLEDPFKFIEWLRSLISADIGGVSVPLTEGQTKRVQSIAQFWKRPVKDVLDQKAKQALGMVLGG